MTSFIDISRRQPLYRKSFQSYICT